MTEIMMAGAVFSSILMLIVLLWLLHENRKLKRDFKGLAERVESNSKDIAGLCSAAVTVDSRMQEHDGVLKMLSEKIAHYEEQDSQNGNTAQPYHSAIQKIHQGASVNDLVSECGISRDEAVLLIRLHSRD